MTAPFRRIAETAALRACRRLFDGAPPIVVGGTGGSGTRVVQNILTRAGVFMGIRLNPSGDAMDFEPFLDQTINRVLVETRSLDYRLVDLSPSLRDEAMREFARAADQLRQDKPFGMHWGWKNGRSMYLLPLIHARYPGMRFVHVLRDGRDMAFSPNRNQLCKHYRSLFGAPAEETDTGAAIRLWAETNLAVAHWSKRILQHRYFPIRFEDLCAEPARTCATLAEGLDLPIDLGELLASSVLPPPTIGRWQKAAGDKPFDVSALAAEALAVFGYR
jgi:hypothetical protein